MRWCTSVKKFYLLMVLFFPFAFLALAQDTSSSEGLTNVGFAPFNLTSSRFNCDGFIESVKPLEELHVAFLYNTFGNDFSCLTRLLSDPRLKTLEVNLINEPGHRNRRLGKYEFLYGVGTPAQYDQKLRRHDTKLKQKFDSYVTPLQEILQQHLQTHTSLLINPGLESNVSVPAGRVLISWARNSFPSARIVWNPYRVGLNTRPAVNADLVEGHGMHPKLKAPCIYNMDGTDVKYKDRPALGENEDIKNYYHSGTPLFQQLEKYANRCEVAFVWTQESNGLSYKNKFKDPRKRNHYISKKMYDKIMTDVIAVQSRGRVAPITDTYTSADDAVVKTCDVLTTEFEDGAKSGKLLKQSEFPDRGAVLILPNSFHSVENAFLVKGNRVVDKYTPVGSYHDGRKLFRSSRSPTTYPFNTYLIVDAHYTRYCYKISNPRIRLD